MASQNSLRDLRLDSLYAYMNHCVALTPEG